MTRINKLVMKGFKSFANKTELVFGKSFNCILGPNGSGKSNVLDALCFVLGKSSIKGLRAEKSANLIYNGGKKKNPAKEGSVSIYFDNKKKIFGKEVGDELEITRTVKGSGQSIYKINNEKRTRQQILDLLSRARINPDGYNIILQGDIVRMVEMTPLERRGMVEEIAGISIYEDKKNKAIRELTRVEEKINEATIILTERETYLKELKKERNQALKFKDLNDKLKQNKATILDRKIRVKKEKRDELDKRIKENEKKIAGLKSDIEKLTKGIADKKKEIDNINKEVEEKGEKEQVALHKELEKIKVDVALNNQRIETIDSEIKKLDDRKGELGETYKELSGKITVLEKSRKDFEAQIKSKEKDLNIIDQRLIAFRKKNKLEDAHDMDKRVAEIDKKADEFQDETHKLREKQQTLLREKDRFELRITSIDEKMDKLLSIESENKTGLTKLKSFKQDLEKKDKELDKAIDYDSSLAAQLGDARDELLKKKEEESTLKARSASIKETLAGGMALNKILEAKEKNSIKGIIGSVSELGNVKDQYALALEVAAGARLTSVAVETDAVGANCIKYLKDNKLGTVSFLPLNKLRTREIKNELRRMKTPGVKGLAIDLITFEEKYRKVFQYVFGNTLIVDTVETARKIGIGKERMVTLTGDVMETSGAMIGGFRARKKGIGFQDKSVADNIAKLDSEIKELASTVANLDVKKRNNEVRIADLRKEKAEFDGEIIKLEKSLHLDSADLNADKDAKKKIASELTEIDKDFEKVRKDLIEKNTELTKLKTEKQKLRDQLTKLRSPTLLAELNSFEQKKSELKEEVAKLQMELKTNDSEKKNILGPEGENIQRILKQHEKEQADFLKEKIELKELIKKQEVILKEKEKKEQQFRAQFKGLFNKRTTLSDEVSKLENNSLNKNNTIRDSEQKNNLLALDNASVKAELAGLEEEYKQYEGIPLFKSKTDSDIEREVKQFERMVSDIGAVNMKALEIYDKAEEEYNSLNKKKDSLSEEREDVLGMISEIDGKKKELFMRTYNVLNENFKRIFGTLTTKGDALFELEDPKDPFNGGMTVKVKLSSKKFMDIRSLSGGEKTLTALAFLFAVQEYSPASFYIMDEVDAALDKHNSEKLAKLIRGYCTNAQYLIISHNDAVISESDSLYGISMDQAAAMSKVTSLKI